MSEVRALLSSKTLEGGGGVLGVIMVGYLKGTIPKYKGRGMIIAWSTQEKFTTVDSSLGFSLTMVSFTKFHGSKIWTSNWPASKGLQVVWGLFWSLKRPKWALIDR